MKQAISIFSVIMLFGVIHSTSCGIDYYSNKEIINQLRIKQDEQIALLQQEVDRTCSEALRVDKEFNNCQRACQQLEKDIDKTRCHWCFVKCLFSLIIKCGYKKSKSRQGREAL
jgi:peptidoglycan hydrolase CwlO-like protein